MEELIGNRTNKGQAKFMKTIEEILDRIVLFTEGGNSHIYMFSRNRTLLELSIE
jgi:hypothetical protein